MSMNHKSNMLCFTLMTVLGYFVLSVFLFPAGGDSLILTKTGQMSVADYVDIQISGNYAYCSTKLSGIDVIDISSPSEPRIAATYGGPGVFYINGNYAYTADTSNGFRIQDISNPLAPVSMGSCKLSGEQPYDEATSVFVEGNYAYVTLLNTGLVIIDISSKQKPSVVGTFEYEYPCDDVLNSECDDPISAYNVVVKGNYAYMVDFVLGLLVVDVSDPANPQQVWWQDLKCNLYDLTIDGDHLYLAAGRRGMLAMDISDPTSPSEAGAFPPPGSGHYDAYDVFISGNTAYVPFGPAGVYLVDITDPTSPASIGNHNADGYKKVFIKGNYAYLTSDYKVNFVVLDISTPSAPTLTGELDKLDSPYRMVSSGNYAYIADSADGLVIVDISDPSAPERVGSYDAPGNEKGIFVKDNDAYLTVYNSLSATRGIYILDVSNPLSPVYKAYWDIPGGTPSGVYVEGSYAYISIASGGNGLIIMDVSDISSPSVVGTYSGGQSNDIVVRNGYAYLALGADGLHVVDISDPANPVLAGKYQHEDFNDAVDVSLKGDYAYVIMERQNMIVVDVSQPSSPKKIAQIDPTTLYGVGRIDIGGDIAFVTAYGEGVFAVDISNPQVPVTAGKFKKLSNWPTDIMVKGDYVYVSDYNEFYILKSKTVTVSTVELTIESSPVPGAVIQVSPVDNFGDGQGKTPFARTYDAGATVNLTAPETFNNTKFVKWEINGMDYYETNPQVTLNASSRATAVYETTASISVSPSSLVFGATTSGLTTGGQTLYVTKTGSGSIQWGVDIAAQGWLICTPGQGTDSGQVTITVNPSGLSSGTYTGTLYFKDISSQEQLQWVDVTLNVYNHNASGVPFGEFATPLEGSTVRSSIPVSGWVLDDIGVESVRIFREENGTQIYIGDAVFVEGARPDVAAAYPGYPGNTKAGWGYMLLTNFLPNGGNGVFKLLAIATDIEGNQVTLGSRTITCDNANAVKPFGALETPEQGGIASGKSYINWGWALTPQFNMIPIDGSTIDVFVDGVKVGNPTYNIYRDDIANFFPGYANSNGAVGYYYLDTTKYKNGVHIIQWVVTDDAGNTDGIGSRFFSINNSAASRSQASVQTPAGDQLIEPDIGKKRGKGDRQNISIQPPVGAQFIEPDNGEKEDRQNISVRIEELERVEIRLASGAQHSIQKGYLLAGDRLMSLPVGSTIKDNKFHWSPGPGHQGRYSLVFLVKRGNGMIVKKKVNIIIEPRRFYKNP